MQVREHEPLSNIKEALLNCLSGKLLKSDLNWKLLVYPELYLGEEYYKGNIEIENGTIHDFLNLAL